MGEFVRIDPPFLRKIATDSERIPSLYYSDYGLVRLFFWKRLEYIYKMIRKYAPEGRSCLDFGGGGGVFLPTLDGFFAKVVCVDLETSEARQVVQQYALKKVRLHQANILETEIGEAPFDVVVAADVLEHFEELGPVVARLREWLKDEGRLFTSLPTENSFYCFLRKVFRVEKPEDHYHDAKKVEGFLRQNGFTLVQRRCLPLVWRILPLYRISVWRKAGTL